MIKPHLPVPDSAALAHSEQLRAHILSVIKANNGRISFAKYMDLALYTPGSGYYSSPLQKFGATGDFTTAPLLSPLFSECLAKQCQEILKVTQGDILEIGAGSGQMAADILLALHQRKALPNHYYILELSADLKRRQQEKIGQLCASFFSKVIWLETLPAFNFKGIVLANEVLDAMPVNLFSIQQNKLYEVEVIEKKGLLQFELFPPYHSEIVKHYHQQIWPSLYTSEINLNLRPWLLSLSDFFKEGVILLIDYGFTKNEYYHVDRNSGTLMCHYQHKAHTDPFLYPGLQDITAHVDFTATAEAAHEAAFDILGFTTQAAFLLGSGLMELAGEKNFKTESERLRQNHAIQTLTSPAEMGELFKVMALGRNFKQPLSGFHLSDRRHTL